MSDLPKVSILVAARNEETYILDCLEHLNQLDYPSELLDVWIGNDASEDNTQNIIQNFIQDKSNFQLLNISENWGDLKGKMNILAQLAHQAKGDFLFFTDADVKVPPTWLKNIVSHFQDDNLGLLTGFTLPIGKNIFAKLQTLDWTWALAGMQLLSYWQIPTTTMGNNMAINKKAYDKVGGYENLPFSTTEDFALYQKIIQKGYSFKNLIQAEIFAVTHPEKTVSNLFQQRLRWMHGAWQSHGLMKFGFIVYLFTFPMSVLAGTFAQTYFWLLLILKFIVDFYLISKALWKMKKSRLLIFFPLYELLQWIFYLVLVGRFLLNKKINWKGRIYQKS